MTDPSICQAHYAAEPTYIVSLRAEQYAMPDVCVAHGCLSAMFFSKMIRALQLIFRVSCHPFGVLPRFTPDTRQVPAQGRRWLPLILRER